MIAFDFSNPTETALRAANATESSYAALQHVLKNDDGGRLTVRTGNPDVQRTAAASDLRRGSRLSAGQYSPVSGITGRQGKTVIQPSRRVFSVPANEGASTSDTLNERNFTPFGPVHPASSTDCSEVATSDESQRFPRALTAHSPEGRSA